jgi:hypothetical protein
LDDPEESIAAQMNAQVLQPTAAPEAGDRSGGVLGSRALSLAKTCSMGLRFGLWGGKQKLGISGLDCLADAFVLVRLMGWDQTA